MLGVRALLEITETEPGKSPTTRKPILKEGERDGTVEVVAIDVEKSMVKIRNGGSETNVTFDTPKLGGAPPGIPGAFPPPPLTTAIPGAPTVFSPANAANAAARNNGMTVYGNTGAGAATGPRGGVQGAYGPAAAAGNDNSGLRSIPTRNNRADGAGFKTYPPAPPLPGR